MGEKYRVAMVYAGAFPSTYGTPVSIREMARAVAKRGHEVHMVVYHVGHVPMPIDGITIHRIPWVHTFRRTDPVLSPQKIFLDFLLCMTLLKVVRKHKIQVIHAHHYEAPLVSYVSKLLTGTKVVFHSHSTLESELQTFTNNRILKWLANSISGIADRMIPVWADYIINSSEELEDFFVRMGKNPDKMCVIYPGVEWELFKSGDGESFRRKYGLDSTPLVVYTGTLSGFQEFDRLLKSMQHLAKKNRDCKLIVASTGSQYNYPQMTRELGIADRVRFLDELPFTDIVDMLQAADVTVVPRCTCAGLPFKMLNYMAAGKAVVSFEGAAKMLTHLESGYIVENENVEAFADAIDTVLHEEQMAKTLGANARNLVKTKYDWSNVAQQIEAVYDTVVHGCTTEKAKEA